MSKVVIKAHPETGKMFTETNNPEIFKCQLQSKEIAVNNKFITEQTRVAFPPLTKEVVEAFSHLKDGDRFPIDGKIRKIVSSIPQFEGHQEVINPKTEEKMGYYQTFEFTSDLNKSDMDLRDHSTEEQAKALGITITEEFESVSEKNYQTADDFQK